MKIFKVVNSTTLLIFNFVKCFIYVVVIKGISHK